MQQGQAGVNFSLLSVLQVTITLRLAIELALAAMRLVVGSITAYLSVAALSKACS